MKLRITAIIMVLALLCGSCCAEKLKIGARTNVYGFSSYNAEHGVWSGMEIDLGMRLAKDLGYDGVKFIGVDSHNREQALLDHTVDCVIAIYSITEERKQTLHFSPSYYTGGVRVMVERSTMFNSTKDLKGMTIGVLAHATAAKTLVTYMMRTRKINNVNIDSFEPSSFSGGIRFREYDSYDSIIADLEIGSIDAVCADLSVLTQYATDERLLLNERISYEEYGVAMLPTSPLCSKIDDLINTYKENGYLEELKQKWDRTEDITDAE